MEDGYTPLVAIAGMALVTLLLRTGGYLIMGRIPLTGRVRRGLEALPGAIIIATILPVALRGGIVAIVGLTVAAVAMAVIRKDLVAVLLGVGAAALLRSYGF